MTDPLTGLVYGDCLLGSAEAVGEQVVLLEDGFADVYAAVVGHYPVQDYLIACGAGLY